MRILIAEDERDLNRILKRRLESAGYSVDAVFDGAEAIDLLSYTDYDGVVLDVMMPKLDGFSACKEIRRIADIPILMLSARGEEYDKLFGFEMGVDDYVVKPFSPKEVMARLNVIITRNHKPVKDENSVEFGGLKINIMARDDFVDGTKVEMTPKEYDLLFYLVRNKNIGMTREKILSEVWGYDFYGDDRTVDTHIKMLRNSLGNYRDYIVTLRGFGYKFEA